MSEALFGKLSSRPSSEGLTVPAPRAVGVYPPTARFRATLGVRT